MKHLVAFLFASVFLMHGLGATPSGAEQHSCRMAEGLSLLPDLPEASGLAVSRRTPGVLWSHNDSGEPLVFALTEKGAVKSQPYRRLFQRTQRTTLRDHS